MCTAFSTWQRIKDKIDKHIVEKEKCRAIGRLKFCFELYREQAKHSRYFLHEHPAYATSYQNDVIKGMLEEKGVERATAGQRMYGCESEDGSPVKKPTTFITSAEELSKQLRARCCGKNRHCQRGGASKIDNAGDG